MQSLLYWSGFETIRVGLAMHGWLLKDFDKFCMVTDINHAS